MFARHIKVKNNKVQIISASGLDANDVQSFIDELKEATEGESLVFVTNGKFTVHHHRKLTIITIPDCDDKTSEEFCDTYQAVANKNLENDIQKTHSVLITNIETLWWYI